MSKRLIWIFVAVVFAVCLTVPAYAAWPEKPVKIIVPFKPGGTTDQTVRMFQKAIPVLSCVLQLIPGFPFIIDFRCFLNTLLGYPSNKEY